MKSYIKLQQKIINKKKIIYIIKKKKYLSIFVMNFEFILIFF